MPDEIAYNPNHRTVEEVIEEIQEAQINCGGRFLKQKEIKKMTVEQLLKLLLPNKVQFKVTYKR